MYEMHKQKGITLSGMLLWGVLLAIIAIIVIKVAPTAVEFYKIRKDIIAVAQHATVDSTVPELRAAYGKYVEVDHISDVLPEDLEITKEVGQIVISVAYEKKIPLYGPVNLLIEYRASSSKR